MKKMMACFLLTLLQDMAKRFGGHVRIQLVNTHMNGNLHRIQELDNGLDAHSVLSGKRHFAHATVYRIPIQSWLPNYTPMSQKPHPNLLPGRNKRFFGIVTNPLVNMSMFGNLPFIIEVQEMDVHFVLEKKCVNVIHLEASFRNGLKCGARKI